MITEKDLELEYKQDTGKNVDLIRNILHCQCPKCETEFEENVDEEPEFINWLIEQHLKLRNNG